MLLVVIPEPLYRRESERWDELKRSIVSTHPEEETLKKLVATAEDLQWQKSPDWIKVRRTINAVKDYYTLIK